MISPFIPSLSMSFPKVHALSNIPLLFHCLTQGLTLSATAGGGEQVGALLDRCRGTSPEGVGEWRKAEGGQAGGQAGGANQWGFSCGAPPPLAPSQSLLSHLTLQQHCYIPWARLTSSAFSSRLFSLPWLWELTNNSCLHIK